MLVYIDVLRNSPPCTLESTLNSEALIKCMFDEANNQRIMDFQFTVGLSAFESSLKWKKNFLSLANKNDLDIELNVCPFKDEPFEFAYLKNKGLPLSKNVPPNVSNKLYWLRILIYLDCIVYPSPFSTCIGYVSTYIVHALYVRCNQSLDACNYYICHDVIQLEMLCDISMGFQFSSSSFITSWSSR